MPQAVAKQEALAFQRRVYVNVARIQEAYFPLAGFDDLAERIRVTEPVRRTEKPAETPEPTPEPTPPSPRLTASRRAVTSRSARLAERLGQADSAEELGLA